MRIIKRCTEGILNLTERYIAQFCILFAFVSVWILYRDFQEGKWLSFTLWVCIFLVHTHNMYTFKSAVSRQKKIRKAYEEDMIKILRSKLNDQ